MSSAIDFGGAGSPTGGPGFVPITLTGGGAGSATGSAVPLQFASTGQGAGSLPHLVSESSDTGFLAALQALYMVAEAGGVEDSAAVISSDTNSSHPFEFAAGAGLPFSSFSSADDAFDLLAWSKDHLHDAWLVV